MKRFPSIGLSFLPFAFLILFLFIPLFQVARHMATDGHLDISDLARIFIGGPNLLYLLNSLNLALLATLLSGIIALPLALLMARYEFFGRRLFGVLALVPMIVPPFVGAIGIRRIFARFGPLNLFLMHIGVIDTPIDWLGSYPFLACTITESLHLYPILYLNLTAALARIDSSFEDAGASLGLSSWRRFTHILIPLLFPALISGAAITLIWAFTDLGTPLVFDYRNVIAVQIFTMADEIHTDPSGYALVFVVLALTLLLFFGLRAVEPKHNAAFANKGERLIPRKRLSGLNSFLAPIFVIAITLLAFIPNLGVVLLSVSEHWFMTTFPSSLTLAGYHELPTHPLTSLGFQNSLLYSIGSTALDVILGISIAWLIVRGTLAPRIWDLATVLPLATPGLVLAFAYLGTFSSGIFAGSIFDPRRDPTMLLIAGYAIRRLPFMVRAVEAGLRRASRELEFSAYSLGISPRKTFARITFPLVLPQIIAGTILCFTFAMLEVSEGLILANREGNYPITKVMYALLGRPDGVLIASALGVCSMILIGVGLALVRRIGHEGRGR